MIRVPVDEAYAFDMLSILRVKNERVPTEKGYEAHWTLGDAIRAEVGSDLFDTIIASKQYADLIAINGALFDALEMLKRTDAHFEAQDGAWPPKLTVGEWPGAATEVDNMVYRRYLCKRALQSTFFPAIAQTERKIGYTPTS